MDPISGELDRAGTRNVSSKKGMQLIPYGKRWTKLSKWGEGTMAEKKGGELRGIFRGFSRNLPDRREGNGGGGVKIRTYENE